MSATLTIDLPDNLKTILGKAAQDEGVSEKDFAEKALEDYLYLRRFRSMRERMIAESDRSYTDEEVFELVS
jgi:predicted transcriptional regulator